jgi:hypothetical protein
MERDPPSIVACTPIASGPLYRPDGSEHKFVGNSPAVSGLSGANGIWLKCPSGMSQECDTAVSDLERQPSYVGLVNPRAVAGIGPCSNPNAGGTACSSALPLVRIDAAFLR